MLGDVEVDLEMHEVRRRDRATHLTGKEFKLLHCLLTHRGEVMSHRRLLQAVWGPDYGDEVEYLRVFINQLRKKVEPDPANPKFIITDPSVGYRLNLEAERHSACVAERGHGGLDGAPASHQGEVRAAVITAPHILVVDDESMLLEIIPRILQSEGFEVRSAENGHQAVEAVRRDDAIAVAILDWRLPGMSGEQVFDQLVAIRPDIRVIVASGNDLSEVGHAFSGRNVDGFLRKPFEVATLVRAVKSVFDPEPAVLPLLALSGDRRWSAENGTSNLEGSQLAAKGGI
jgi:DNA-binding response OmpR family regulator